MPYKPLDLSTFKIDAKVASILKIGQQEYQTILGIGLIQEEIAPKIAVVEKTQAVESVPSVELVLNTDSIDEQDPEKDKKISEIVFDFLFEPKFDNMFTMFSKKAS
ncbi:hypothetical protein [Tenacibaculum piscium]|uniref:Uncharacterized protein n=1 Tax=Tenacibaculum piscium TaxID=1458515 RepID=A0A2H1YK40_9FLAO|nr:hypothetical protein [Tenacibaculum piscium]MBE7629333.1 hypothetical protein [Tenacibaculum piscium]SOS75876.1 conserved hypothetical protein [Tenacibaculum piscium]